MNATLYTNTVHKDNLILNDKSFYRIKMVAKNTDFYLRVVLIWPTWCAKPLTGIFIKIWPIVEGHEFNYIDENSVMILVVNIKLFFVCLFFFFFLFCFFVFVFNSLSPNEPPFFINSQPIFDNLSPNDPLFWQLFIKTFIFFRNFGQ